MRPGRLERRLDYKPSSRYTDEEAYAALTFQGDSVLGEASLALPYFKALIAAAKSVSENGTTQDFQAESILEALISLDLYDYVLIDMLYKWKTKDILSLLFAFTINVVDYAGVYEILNHQQTFSQELQSEILLRAEAFPRIKEYFSQKL